MKRLIRYLAILAGTLIAVLVLVLVFARFYFTDEKILSVVRPQLEKNLNRTIEIENAELSFWGGIGVRLEGVTLGNAPGFSRPFFLHLGELDVKVRFWPLISGQVIFDRVLIGPGELRLEIDSLGQNNWSDIAKRDTAAVAVTPADSALAVLPRIPVVGKMRFSAITVYLENHAQGRLYELADIEGWLALEPQLDDSSVAVSGRFEIGGGVIQADTSTWDLSEARPTLDFDLRASLPRQRLDLQSLNLRVFGVPIELSGTVENLRDTAQYTLGLRIEPAQLDQIFDRLPDSVWQLVFPDGPPEGTIQADLAVSSPPPDVSYPQIEGKILLSGLRGQFGEKKISFDIAGLDIRVAKTVASVAVQSMFIAGVPLSANLAVDQPHQPNFSGSISGTVEIARLGELLEPESSAEMGGKVKFAVSGFGAVKNWRDLNVNGKIDLTQVYWRVPDTLAFAVDDLSGSIRFSGKGAKIENLRLRSGQSVIEANGQLDDLVPYLTHGGKEVGKPHLQFELRSRFADLDRMFPEDDSQGSSEETPALPIIDLVADGTIHLDSAIYFGVPFANLTCTAHFADLVLTLSEAHGRAYGGEVGGEVSVDFTDFDRPAFVVDAQAKAIEANEFIDNFTGFGGHLFGKIDLTGVFAGQGEEIGEIVRSLTAHGKTSMTDGRFAELGLLSVLGSQAGISGIHDAGPIKDMSADFWIEDGRLYCSDWGFVSSGTHYNLTGSVGFDGSLDYRVRITLPKQEGGKSLLSTLGDLLSGGGGGVTINLELTGTYDKPSIKLDSRENRKSFEKNLKDKARGLLEHLRRR